MTILRVGDLNLDLDGFGMVGRAVSGMCALFGIGLHRVLARGDGDAAKRY